MAKFQVGDRVKVKQSDYSTISGWTGEIVEVKEDPEGYVIMKADKTGYRMAFHEREIDKV